MQFLFSDMNKKFNNPVMTTPSQSEFDRLSKQIFYSLDELKELEDSADLYGKIDAIGDVVVFLKGFRYMAGAKDDYTVNVAVVCNYLEMLKPGVSDSIVMSEYPIHAIYNELQPMGLSVGFDEFEKTMIESGPTNIALSLMESNQVDLNSVSKELNQSLKVLIENAVTACKNGDIAGAMFLSDKAIALCYIITTIANVNLDIVLTSIYESNMTKFCKDESELSASIQAYTDAGIKVVEDTGTDFPFKVIRSAEEQTVNGKLYSAGKFLKSVTFKEPTFTVESVKCS